MYILKDYSAPSFDPLAFLTLDIDRSIMRDDVSYVPGIVIGHKTNTLRWIVSHPSGNEAWNPVLPVSDDLWAIFPTYCLSQVNVEIAEVNKGSVNWKWGHWTSLALLQTWQLYHVATVECKGKGCFLLCRISSVGGICWLSNELWTHARWIHRQH